MKYIYLTCYFLVFTTYLNAQNITPADLQKVSGSWIGDLTYTDYKDDVSQTKLKCELKAQWSNKKGLLNYTYTEPNGQIFTDRTKLKLRKNGTQLKFDSKYNITSFSKHKENNGWELTANTTSKDNNKVATVQLVVSFSTEQLIITKFVKYTNTSDFFIRNRYTFTRK